MGTYLQLTDRVLARVRSFVRDQELSTHLTASIGAATTTLPVDNASFLSRGRLEIEDELVWIDSASQDTNTATVPPYGRGMDGTTAAGHDTGSRVIFAPLFPRKMVKDTINQAIQTVGASLYGVAATSLTPSSTSFTYELPAAVRSILAVQVVDSLDTVVYLRDWVLDKRAPSTVSSTGKALYLSMYGFSGLETIEVSYTRDPAPLVSDSDDFTDSFLPASSEDCIELLAASMLLATADSWSVQTRSMEAGALNGQRQQANPAVAQSKYLYGLFQARLDEERRRLMNDTPIRTHYSR